MRLAAVPLLRTGAPLMVEGRRAEVVLQDLVQEVVAEDVQPLPALGRSPAPDRTPAGVTGARRSERTGTPCNTALEMPLRVS